MDGSPHQGEDHTISTHHSLDDEVLLSAPVARSPPTPQQQPQLQSPPAPPPTPPPAPPQRAAPQSSRSSPPPSSPTHSPASPLYSDVALTPETAPRLEQLVELKADDALNLDDLDDAASASSELDQDDVRALQSLEHLLLDLRLHSPDEDAGIEVERLEIVWGAPPPPRGGDTSTLSLVARYRQVHTHPAVRAFVLHLIHLHARFQLPHVACNMSARVMYGQWTLLGLLNENDNSPDQQAPRTLTTMYSRMGLEDRFQTYALCTKCWQLRLDDDAGKSAGWQ
ncbi:hypothetical protein CALCODRAFT_480791 [Calocera cornea HHB12733]|uniref:Uncharacterized protein n=1 Tax=Calocera cornea HHB12733 TaxID=1353952 RepID=A0A165I8R5_9BASI|nr:hypothetical protein CALCODRAFT_480791 [Calocera cornea HHB12733]